MSSYAEQSRKLLQRAIVIVGQHHERLKRQLRACKDEAERRRLKKEIAWWKKEIRQATERLDKPFIDPHAAAMAKSRRDRKKAEEHYRKLAEKASDMQREERERRAQEAHREAVEKAKEEGRPAPPPPKRRKGKQVSALNFLAE